MRKGRMIWRPAPGWPEAPSGWQPPPGWSPPPEWPPAPPDWAFWTPAEPGAPAQSPAPVQPGAPAQPAASALPPDMTRAGLVLETRLVMIAGLFPWIAAAVVILAKHVDTGQILTQLPSITPHQPVLNVILSVLSYLPSASIVPLVLLLLIRTGQRPSDLGLTRLPPRDLGGGSRVGSRGPGPRACSGLRAQPAAALKVPEYRWQARRPGLLPAHRVVRGAHHGRGRGGNRERLPHYPARSARLVTRQGVLAQHGAAC